MNTPLHVGVPGLKGPTLQPGSEEEKPAPVETAQIDRMHSPYLFSQDSSDLPSPAAVVRPKLV